MRKLLLFGLLLSFNAAFAQPVNDNCAGATIAPQDGTCINGTTVAATDGWTGSVGCQAAGGSPEVWYTFTATGTNASLVVTNGTMTGNVEIIMVLPNCAAMNCMCPFLLEGSDCGPSPNTATFNSLIIGQTYYYTINSSTGSAGTFTSCLTVTNPPPVTGQECTTAVDLCDGLGFSVPVVALGDGVVEENWDCILNENNSQWYQFTAGSTGTWEMLLDPATYNSATQFGDDYDFSLIQLAGGACPTSSATANTLACNFSGCSGSTGTSPTGAAGWGQTSGTDFQNNNPAGPGDCLGSPSPQWNVATVNLTAGNTYALLIQNYTGSTGGVTVDFGGTAGMGPQAAFTFTDGCATDLSVTAAATNAIGAAGWTYSWNWGDGTTSTGTPATHNYAASGSYNVTLTVTDPLGCSVSQILGTTCTLPVQLLYFDAKANDAEVDLKWETASEENNDYFTVEKSLDGIHFEFVGQVDGAGTINTPRSYSLTDGRPFVGTNYYRLRQTDYDGTSFVTQPIPVKVEQSNEISIVPNPATEMATLRFEGLDNSPVYVRITDISGKTVFRQAMNPDFENLAVQQINLSEYKKGTYLVFIQQGDKIYYRKLQVVK